MVVTTAQAFALVVGNWPEPIPKFEQVEQRPSAVAVAFAIATEQQ